ncbi:MAG: signal recognition particle-docking protein FtsY [Candidatus Fermentibacteraceae bacterium]|nr:signal recognition particle-docking protein FtsY [Candidatus Fermentibacteraceae bacterium]
MLDLRRRLKKSSEALAGRLAGIFGGTVINEDQLKQAEEVLLGSDLGWELTERVLEELPSRVRKTGFSWREALAGILIESVPVPRSQPVEAKPEVTVVIGVNGAGKTTTIARLAAMYQSKGLRVLLACADTFRAAAAEQLEVWAGRLDSAVLTQLQGSDAGAVVFDAIKKGLNRNYDAVLIDTAGRLPNKKGLLDELSKIYKVAGKAMDTAPHRVLLVLDGTVGQNALSQARQFMGAMPVTGLVITKLDGTARGGAVLSMASILGIPVEYIGVGEGEADLVAFNMESFVHALLDMDGDGP